MGLRFRSSGVGVACILAFCFAIEARGQCPASSGRGIDPLLTYVKRRYGLPADLELALHDTGTRLGCYKEVRFFSKSPMQPFEVTLYLSSDERFLAPDVFDLSEDPARQRELASLRLQQRLGSAPASTLGISGAPVSIVMFTDFQCDFCRRAADLIEKEILPTNEEKVDFVIRHHPLPSHDWARSAAELAICASIQSSDFFWMAHDYILRSQAELTAATIRPSLVAHLSSAPGFNRNAFEACVNSAEPKQRLLEDDNLSQSLSIDATPTFFVNGIKQVGMSDPDQFRDFILRRIHAATK